MSDSLSPPWVVSPYGSLQEATTLKQRFYRLSAEIKMMILCTMTAAELIDFRCCCTAFNEIFTKNESAIIRGILRNPFYHTITALYDTVTASGPLKFECLKQIARRCDIVETLATAIAEHNAREDLTTSTRMAKNLKPYLIALGHFFERYRTTLANYTYDRYDVQSINWARDNLDGEILKAHYKEKTAQRICLTYELVNRILKQQLPRGLSGLPNICHQFHDLIYPSWTIPPGDMYTVGGLEMIKDILTRPPPTDRRKLLVSYCTKTMPSPYPTGSRVPLPPSVLGPRLSAATTRKICFLFPVKRPLLQLSHLAGLGFRALTDEEEVEVRREFFDFVRSYEGKEDPDLVRDRGVAFWAFFFSSLVRG